MNVARRLFSTTARTAAAEASAIAPANSSHIPAKALPPVLQAFIKDELRKRKVKQPEFSVHNPFLPRKVKHISNNSRVPSRTNWNPATIPNRRQKLLLLNYDGSVLPPSPANPVLNPAPIQWTDGTLIRWAGNFQVPKGETSVYGKRKEMFKGKKVDREKPKRIQEREERMQGMEKRIETWKKAKEEIKDKDKPSLPF